YRPGDRGFHRSHAHAENLGDLPFGHVLVVAEHDGEALTLGEALQRAAQCVAHLGLVRVVVGDGTVGELLGRVDVQFLPAPPGDLRVDHGAADVPVDGAAVPDAVPGQVGLGERRLEEVLGLGAVAGQLGRGAQQHRSAFRHVRAELLLPRPVQFTTGPGVAEPPTAG